ncbi:MAG TPA: hypothetical protein VMY18_04605 [Acidobacteriota bacterium]|nr:hypothetical protein [Acidobacteriota bacterium]
MSISLIIGAVIIVAALIYLFWARAKATSHRDKLHISGEHNGPNSKVGIVELSRSERE